MLPLRKSMKAKRLMQPSFQQRISAWKRMEAWPKLLTRQLPMPLLLAHAQYRCDEYVLSG